jgi:hypothetical protein
LRKNKSQGSRHKCELKGGGAAAAEDDAPPCVGRSPNHAHVAAGAGRCAGPCAPWR